MISVETPGSGPDPDPALRAHLEAQVAPRYAIERELGGGGMSRVFLAREPALNRRVVIKVLPPSLVAGLSANRFRREILVSAALQHPHIVPVLAAGELDGLPYFVMPFIDGESLRQHLHVGQLPVTETVSILRDVGRALAFAHGAGVVHRDIKPDNILLAQGTAVVTDFGVAKAVVEARASDTPVNGTHITAVGVSLGTPAYMAPEQAAADPRTDHRADLYAFGVVAYEMLAGTPPFVGSRSTDLLRAHLTEIPRPLRELRPDVPSALEAIVMRCLAKDPDERFQNASDLLRALEMPETISGEIAGAILPRRPRWYAGAAVALAIVAAAVIALVVMNRKPIPVAASKGIVIEMIPFQSRTADGDTTLTRDVFADLTGALRAVPGVSIMESAALADSTLSQPTLVLRGTLQQSGERLRSNLRLSMVANDSTVWSGRFEGTVGDILGFEDQIAKAAEGGLKAWMSHRGEPASR